MVQWLAEAHGSWEALHDPGGSRHSVQFLDFFGRLGESRAQGPGLFKLNVGHQRRNWHGIF